ncbi:hypothetical protein M9H77_26989 [Catharanthus roseus]|uniref:Uncharacterized protein n=1 Tax=Catharanthus roseus TaxID=4058 RepID=A0ACC0ABR1_CATRO|nr:hypothetical protein M9H77_26989 [Catharanthus roseus]
MCSKQSAPSASYIYEFNPVCLLIISARIRFFITILEEHREFLEDVQLLGSLRVKFGKEYCCSSWRLGKLAQNQATLMKLDLFINDATLKDSLALAQRIVQDICNLWMRFEREYGSLEDYDIAVQKVTPRLAELQVFRRQQENKSTGISDQRENSMKKTTREKRKLDSEKTDNQSRAKRQKDTTHHVRMNSEKEQIQGAEFGRKNKVEGGEPNDSKLESTSRKETNNPSPKKPKHYNDQCTAFISNLNFKTTAEDLRAFFRDVGGVIEVRILKDKFTGKSRGLAYVDFAEDAHLAAALAKNKQNLQGKRLSIARSDPQGKRKGTVGRSNTSKHGAADKQPSEAQSSDSKDSSVSHKETSQKHREEIVQLKGRNTFAMPRSLRPLGWTKTEPGGTEEAGDEKPKSNDEFRKMFVLKEDLGQPNVWPIFMRFRFWSEIYDKKTELSNGDGTIGHDSTMTVPYYRKKKGILIDSVE